MHGKGIHSCCPAGDREIDAIFAISLCFPKISSQFCILKTFGQELVSNYLECSLPHTLPSGIWYFRWDWRKEGHSLTVLEEGKNPAILYEWVQQRAYPLLDTEELCGASYLLGAECFCSLPLGIGTSIFPTSPYQHPTPVLVYA